MATVGEKRFALVATYIQVNINHSNTVFNFLLILIARELLIL